MTLQKHLLMTNYNQAKSMLGAHARWLKARFTTDKPAIRQGINEYADSICRDFDLSEYHRNLLANFACKLHPK